MVENLNFGFVDSVEIQSDYDEWAVASCHPMVTLKYIYSVTSLPQI